MFVVTTYFLSCAVIQYDDRVEETSPEYGVEAENILKNRWFGLTKNKSYPSRSDAAGNVQNTKAHDWEA